MALILWGGLPDMNSFYITGPIQAFEVKDTKFPSLWIKVALDPYKVSSDFIDNNYMFVQADISNDTSTKKGRVSSYIKSALKKDKFVYLEDATFSLISRSRKVGDEWEKYQTPGFKINVSNISIYDERPVVLNHGIISGKIVNFKENKAILEESYRVPDGTVKTRSLPILFSNKVNQDLLNKYVTIFGEACGVTPNGESTHFTLAKSYIIK